jgi:ribonucleoside-triphosphate reductase
MNTHTLDQQTIQWGPIGEEVYRRSYSRQRDDGSWETWPDTVQRVVTGTSSLSPIDESERQRLQELMLDFKLLPAGRHLWITGTGLPYTRNCWRAGWTARLADHFEFASAQLLTGGGVGANYSTEYLTLSPVIGEFALGITCDPSHVEYEQVREAAGAHWVERSLTATVRMEDTREEWSRLWGMAFDAATGAAPQTLVVDVSRLRPFGAPVKTFGGTASGPVPFVRALVGIKTVLDSAVGRHLTPIEAMQCDHHIAAAVVSGGVRRSARWAGVHWRDPYINEFLTCKQDHSSHWSTNISVEIDDDFIAALNRNDPHAAHVFDSVIRGMYLNGEPGFFNSSLAAIGERGDVRATNPCGEIPLEASESCNIGSVNLAAFGTDTEGAVEAFRLMARFLLRATMMPHPDRDAAEIEHRNRRIGVGFLGLQEWAAAHGVRYSDIPKSSLLRSLLYRFRSEVRDAADEYARELGVPAPIKVTAIAPNGTIAQLPGTQPGIHPIYARHFVRRVQYTWSDPRLAEAYDRGLHVEDSIYAASTAVVSYPVRDSILDRYDEGIVQQSDEISISDQLAVLAFVTDSFCSGRDGNAVSFTANFDPATVSESELGESVRRWLPHVKGLTAFPALSRPQSPYEAVSRDEFALLSAGMSLDELRGDSNSGECRGAACPIR